MFEGAELDFTTIELYKKKHTTMLRNAVVLSQIPFLPTGADLDMFITTRW